MRQHDFEKKILDIISLSKIGTLGMKEMPEEREHFDVLFQEILEKAEWLADNIGKSPPTLLTNER